MNVAIVTGVSQGLGEAVAIELLARGCRVIGVGRRSSTRLAGDRYGFVACDLARIDSIESLARALKAIRDEHPALACLINNAATIEPVGVLGTLQSADILRSLTVNLVAPAAMSNLFCRIFDDDAIERRIINVSSGAAQSTLTGESLYCVAKAGLEMLTRSLAAENTSARFRAITLRPGVIDTPMQAFARSRSERELPSVDLFKGFHAQQQLVAPEVVARKLVDRLVFEAIDHGHTYSYAEL